MPRFLRVPCNLWRYGSLFDGVDGREILDADPTIGGRGTVFELIQDGGATRIDAVRLLVDRGLDPHEVGGDGLTPLEWAGREGRAEVADYLRGLG